MRDWKRCACPRESRRCPSCGGCKASHCVCIVPASAPAPPAPARPALCKCRGPGAKKCETCGGCARNHCVCRATPQNTSLVGAPQVASAGAKHPASTSAAGGSPRLPAGGGRKEKSPLVNEAGASRSSAPTQSSSSSQHQQRASAAGGGGEGPSSGAARRASKRAPDEGPSSAGPAAGKRARLRSRGAVVSACDDASSTSGGEGEDGERTYPAVTCPLGEPEWESPENGKFVALLRLERGGAPVKLDMEAKRLDDAKRFYDRVKIAAMGPTLFKQLERGVENCLYNELWRYSNEKWYKALFPEGQRGGAAPAGAAAPEVGWRDRKRPNAAWRRELLAELEGLGALQPGGHEEEDEKEYDVAAILAQRGNRFLVRWKGWDGRFNTWVERENLDAGLVAEFLASTGAPGSSSGGGGGGVAAGGAGGAGGARQEPAAERVRGGGALGDLIAARKSADGSIREVKLAPLYADRCEGVWRLPLVTELEADTTLEQILERANGRLGPGQAPFRRVVNAQGYEILSRDMLSHIYFLDDTPALAL
eukprot:tig00021275_g19875.t1